MFIQPHCDDEAQLICCTVLLLFGVLSFSSFTMSAAPAQVTVRAEPRSFSVELIKLLGRYSCRGYL